MPLYSHAKGRPELWRLCLEVMEACLHSRIPWSVRGFYAMRLVNWMTWDLAADADRLFACRILASIEPFPDLVPRLELVLGQVIQARSRARRGIKLELRLEAEKCLQRWRMTIPVWHLMHVGDTIKESLAWHGLW